MKKLFLLFAICITVFSSCSKSKNSKELSGSDYYDWELVNDITSYYIQHDTNSIGRYAADFVIDPGGELQIPTMDAIHAKTWTIDASTISSINNVVGNRGSVSVSGALLQTQYTITHSLGYTPTMVFIQPKSTNAAVPSWVDNITSTTFRVTFASVPVIGTNNISFNWIAYKN